MGKRALSIAIANVAKEVAEWKGKGKRGRKSCIGSGEGEEGSQGSGGDRGMEIVATYKRRPFILRPERKGMEPWFEVLRKLGVSRGNPNWVCQFVPSMTARGKPLGISFDFGGNVGNSLSSLRLLKWIQTTGGKQKGGKGCKVDPRKEGWDKAEQVADLLAKWHFEQKRCVGDPQVLLAACEAVNGIDLKVAKEVLESKEYSAEVEKEIEALHFKGIHSIPVFFLRQTTKTSDKTKQFQISGAASVEEFEQVIRQLIMEITGC